MGPVGLIRSLGYENMTYPHQISGWAYVYHGHQQRNAFFETRGQSSLGGDGWPRDPALSWHLFASQRLRELSETVLHVVAMRRELLGIGRKWWVCLKMGCSIPIDGISIKYVYIYTVIYDIISIHIYIYVCTYTIYIGNGKYPRYGCGCKC